MAALDRRENLFDRTQRPPRRRVVVTGQVGVDKKPMIEEVAGLAQQRGHELTCCHVGDMMYREAPDVVPGRILDLPLGRLNSLRRAAFKDILATAKTADQLLVNTHATFRWRHGLFPAFDHDQMVALDADLYITLVDNVDAMHERLSREHDVPHTLKDLLVWREEEILATEVLAHAIRGHGCFYVLARSGGRQSVESFYRLMFEPDRKKVYPSFPMTLVMDQPDVLADIDRFRAAMGEHFILFDPGDLDEKYLLYEAGAATQRGEDTFTLEVNNGRKISLHVSDVTSCARDIDGQIYARDFKLIEQADMIVSYIPTLPGGQPAISSGVERELQHAYECTKEVYVLWTSRKEPSPFVTETATRVFSTLRELMSFFQTKGYVGHVQLDLDG